MLSRKFQKLIEILQVVDSELSIVEKENHEIKEQLAQKMKASE